MLKPVVQQPSQSGYLVSVEKHHGEVAMVALQHGSAVINLTGRVASDSLCRAITAHDAGAIVDHCPRGNVRGHNAQPDASPDRLHRFSSRLFAGAGGSGCCVSSGVVKVGGLLRIPERRLSDQWPSVAVACLQARLVCSGIAWQYRHCSCSGMHAATTIGWAGGNTVTAA